MQATAATSHLGLRKMNSSSPDALESPEYPEYCWLEPVEYWCTFSSDELVDESSSRNGQTSTSEDKLDEKTLLARECSCIMFLSWPDLMI
jgi:hypothetical protein